MGEMYEQFLGSQPGIMVELVDGDSSPYLLRSVDGFDFYVGADDFHNFYRKEGEPTPAKWGSFVTESDGLIRSDKMIKVMKIIHHFEDKLKNFAKARSLVLVAAELINNQKVKTTELLLVELEKIGWSDVNLSNKDLDIIMSAPKEIMSLLSSPACALGAFPEQSVVRNQKGRLAPSDLPRKTNLTKKPIKGFRGRMKNIEMTVEGDILVMKIDLSKEFGPSKSGKTIIIASTEGNMSLPGRDEKVGLNIYKSPTPKSGSGTGQKDSFKNVAMKVEGHELVLTVDLTQEFGPSKSGKTTIIASTEGNQLIFGREEKIGLNVYKKLEQ